LAQLISPWCCLLGIALLPAAGLCAERPLRIVTFNVQCLQAPETKDSRLSRFRWSPARRAHLEAIAGVIETLEPDICALVEVTGPESVNRLVNILHHKGLGQYRGHHVESQDRFSGFDVAFVTRTAADRVGGQSIHHFAPSGDDSPWRQSYAYTDERGTPHQHETTLARHALLYTTVAGHKLAFLGLHLKSDPSDERANARRGAEAQIAQRIIQTQILERGYQPVVLGDLNDYDPEVPDRDPLRSSQTEVLRTLKDYDAKRKGNELVNVARHIQRPEDRMTSHWDRNENGAADSEDVYTMIDHILLPEALEKHLRRTFVSRGTDLSTSDHWPLVVDLVLPESTEKPPGGTK
jgi:endonuclease/exonuclease/phosphatase family metal-dependent hydrolase